MQVLYLSYDGMTDPLGQAQVIPYLIGLSAKGYQFTIISAEKSERFHNTGSNISLLLKKNNINWLPIPYHKKPPVLSTLRDLYTMQKVALNLNPRPQLIHCRSYPGSWVGAKIAQDWNIPFIFDMRGFWADERVEGKLWNTKKPLYKIIYQYFKKKEKSFFTQAAGVVSLTQAALPVIQNLVQQPIDIRVIPCCVDIAHFSYQDSNLQNELRNKLDLSKDDFVLGYAGSLGTHYMMEEMLDFFVCLCKSFPQAKMLWITPDAPDALHYAAQQKGISAEQYRVCVGTRHEMPALLQICTLHLYFIKPTFSKIASSPTKLAEILASGKPVITNTGIGDVDTILSQNDAGILVNSFDTLSYKLAIEKITLLLNKPTTFYLQVAVENFSLTHGVEAYSKLYNDILNQKG